MSEESLDQKQLVGDVRSFRQLLPFFAPYYFRIVAAGMLLLSGAVLMLLSGFGIKVMIDRGFGDNIAQDLDRTTCIMLAGVLIFGVIGYVRSYTVSWLGEHV